MAGGQYVDALMAAPGAEGLFQAAISQSPPCVRQLTLSEVRRSFFKARWLLLPQQHPEYSRGTARSYASTHHVLLFLASI